MTIQDVVSQFNTTPFIFAGSGITRRYYNLPDWAGLLSIFANRISKDPFAYRSYENQAQYSARTPWGQVLLTEYEQVFDYPTVR